MTPIERVRARSAARNTLGVSPNASKEDISKAWHRKARRLHPDRHDGDAAAFHRAREAHDMLMAEISADCSRDSRSNSRSNAPGRKPDWRRPVLRQREIPVPAGADAACRAQLEAQGEAANGHVPALIRQCGREVTFVFRSALGKGCNHAALPAWGARSGDGMAAHPVRFSSPVSGSGMVILPEEMRAAQFPDARRVRLQFTGTPAQ